MPTTYTAPALAFRSASSRTVAASDALSLAPTIPCKFREPLSFFNLSELARRALRVAGHPCFDGGQGPLLFLDKCEGPPPHPPIEKRVAATGG